jgi:hypothetical protein
MDKFDRIFQVHAILASRRIGISLEDLMARRECSKSTLYRAINVLKDTLHAPVEFDAELGGFRYADGAEAFISFRAEAKIPIISPKRWVLIITYPLALTFLCFSPCLLPVADLKTTCRATHKKRPVSEVKPLERRHTPEILGFFRFWRLIWLLKTMLFALRREL